MKKAFIETKRRREKPCVGTIFLSTFLVYIVGFHALANLPLSEGLLYGVHMRFWQQPNIIVFIYAGLGLATIFDRVLRWTVAPDKSWLTFVKARSCLLLLSSCACVLIGVQYHRWHDSVGNQSQNWFIPNYAKALLAPLPPNALVFVNYDLQWTSMRYLQRCEQFR
jgi:hypothetical protein